MCSQLLATKCVYTKCIPQFDKILQLYILYTKCSYAKCIQNVSIFREIFDTKCISIASQLQNVCIQNVAIPHFDKLVASYMFYMQNLAGTLILYIHKMQLASSILQKFVEMWQVAQSMINGLLKITSSLPACKKSVQFIDMFLS